MKRIPIFFIIILGVLCVNANDLASGYDQALDALNSKTASEAKADAATFLSQAKSEGDTYYLTKAYYLMGYLSAETEDFGSAVVHYLEGARFAETQSSKEIQNDLISIYKNLGNILGDYHHFDEAHKFIGKGLEIALSLDNRKQIINLYSNRVHEYIEEKKYIEAINTIQEVLKNHQPDVSSQISLKNKEGIAYMELGQYEDAKKSFNYVLYNTKQDNNYHIHSLHNLGEIYSSEKTLPVAINYYERAIQTASNSTHGKKIAVNSLSDLALLRFTMNDYSLGIKHLLNAVYIDTTYNSSNNPDTYHLYKELSQAYDHIGNVRNALTYNTIYSIKLEEFIHKQKEVLELDKKYNIQLLTQRYYELMTANEEKREAERMAQFGIGGSLLFLLLFGMVYFRYNNIRYTIKKELAKIELLSDV